MNKLHKNYPNPFNPTTTISFTLAKTEKVAIELFNLRGQKLICLVDDYYQAGNHKIVWNGIDDNNNKIASGIYLYRMKTENYTEVNTLIMLK